MKCKKVSSYTPKEEPSAWGGLCEGPQKADGLCKGPEKVSFNKNPFSFHALPFALFTLLCPFHQKGNGVLT